MGHAMAPQPPLCAAAPSHRAGLSGEPSGRLAFLGSNRLNAPFGYTSGRLDRRSYPERPAAPCGLLMTQLLGSAALPSHAMPLGTDTVERPPAPPPAAIAIVNEFDIRRPSLRKQRQHLPTVSVEVPFCLSGTPSAHVVRLDQPYREESHANHDQDAGHASHNPFNLASCGLRRAGSGAQSGIAQGRRRSRGHVARHHTPPGPNGDARRVGGTHEHCHGFLWLRRAGSAMTPPSTLRTRSRRRLEQKRADDLPNGGHQ